MKTIDEKFFTEQFLTSFKAIGSVVSQKYQTTIKHYEQTIVPFERSRLAESQTLVFRNSTLEKDKLQLRQKIDKYKSENDRIEYTLEKQHAKINEYERTIEELQQMNIDNTNVIESLRLNVEELKQVLSRRLDDIKQIQKDKSSIMEQYETKNNDYNILLANFINSKNAEAEKINQMNDLEHTLLEKEKELKSQEFYLQKMWEQFDEASKKPKESTKTQRKQKIFDPQQPFKPQKESYYESQTKNQKDINCEILRMPMKKIFKHHHNEIYDMSFNYNGNLLASCGGDRFLKVQDVMGMKQVSSIMSNSAQSIFVSVALNYGGERVLAGSTDKTVNIFNSENGKLLHTFQGHGAKVNCVSWASTRQKCISGSDDKQIKIWEIQKAANLFSIQCERSVKTITSNNVEPVVYSGHSDGSVKVYSINQGKSPISMIKGIIDYSINSISLMSDKKVLVASSEGDRVHLLDLKMNKCLNKYQHKEFFNTQVRSDISPSESLVLAGNCDGSIYYWNRFDGKFIKKISGHDSSISCLKYHFMNNLLASSDKEGNLIIWQ